MTIMMTMGFTDHYTGYNDDRWMMMLMTIRLEACVGDILHEQKHWS